MSVTARSIRREPPVSRRGPLALGGMAIAAALSVAIPGLSQSVHDGIDKGIRGVQTVAAMLAERSPGARSVGELAQLKHKRQAALHQHALPKIRGPYTPPSAYQALSSPPPVALLPPPPAPLFATVAGGPEVITPVGGTPGGSFGPPVFAGIPSPGGGGGGAFTPPIVTAVTPQVPVTPAAPVPEPASWAMMLLGFGLMGAALRYSVTAGYRRIGD